MATPKRRDIPFPQIVQAIIDEPLEMTRRLDFADWLQRHGDAPRACWIRECCAIWDTILPLLMGGGNACGLIIQAPWGIVDLTGSAVNRWQEVRPYYWTEISGATQTPYFGRIVIASLESNETIQRIGETPWLPQALDDGWLESICLMGADGRQLGRLVSWPDTHRKLPLHVDTTYYSSAEIDDGLMRETLSLEGLQGLVLSQTEIRYPCVKRFAELATNLRYLRLYLKAASTSLRVLEQLPHLGRLRSLGVGGNLPDDSSVALLTRIPNLQTLRLYAPRITDAGLLQLATIKSLRALAVDAPKVSRHGIEAIRETRPDLKVIIERDMRNRLGPV